MLRSNLKNFFEFEISRQLTFWFIFSYLFLYVVGLIAVIGLSHTLWTDEHHFEPYITFMKALPYIILNIITN
jgi:hypothetical protein